jgi:hypothetical protein
MMLTAPPSSPDEAQQKHSADMLVFYLSKSIGLYSICCSHENLPFMRHSAAEDPYGFLSSGFRYKDKPGVLALAILLVLEIESEGPG